jgi:hypothetical protein
MQLGRRHQTYHSLINGCCLNNTPNDTNCRAYANAVYSSYSIIQPSREKSSKETGTEEDTIHSSDNGGGMAIARCGWIRHHVQRGIPCWLPKGRNNNSKTEATEEGAYGCEEDDLCKNVSLAIIIYTFKNRMYLQQCCN